MSTLRVGDDDHPMAATKHLRDARVLHDAGRPDGSAYLSGYVVECALKAVLLHDRAWDPTLGAHDPQRLASRVKDLGRRPLGHNLVNLATQHLGAIGARYWPEVPYVATSRNQSAAVLTWKETLRYAAEDPKVGEAAQRATSYLEWATYVHDHAIVEMRLDGVL